MARRVGLAVLTLAVAGQLVLPLFAGPLARGLQAALVGLAPAALVAISFRADGGSRRAVLPTLLLGLCLAASLVLLVVLDASGPVESAEQAMAAPVVMIFGLVLVPLALVTWAWLVGFPEEG